MPITHLRVTNIGPFAELTMTCDEHINVLVGPNSSGKSTSLMALAHLVAYPLAFPSRLLRPALATGTVRFLGRDGQTHELHATLPVERADPTQQLRWAQLLAVLGYTAFAPALRQSTSFRASDAAALLGGSGASTLPEELRRRQTLLPTDAGLMRDEGMLACMVDLAEQATRRNDPALRRLLTQIATIASEILAGFPIEFWRIAEDRDGQYPQFRTRDGDVAFSVFSQGTQSIMQWLAHVLLGYARYYGYPTNLAEQPGVAIIDEIDAHVHPAAQQRLLPVLQKHFPRLQIFCSTHAPLMLANLQPGQLHLLSSDPAGQVTTTRNTHALIGYSTDALLQQFFGVEAAN